MEQIVLDRGAIVVSRVRFVISSICLFLLASVHVFHTAETEPVRTLFFHIMLLSICLVVIYVMPSALFRAVPVFYGATCAVVILGVLVGKNFSALGPALLPLFLLAIPDHWKLGRVFLFSLPALIGTAVLCDWASLLQTGLAVCVICYISGFMEDEEDNEEDSFDEEQTQEANPAEHKKWLRTIFRAVLFLAFVFLLLNAIHMYVSRPVKTAYLSMLLISSVLLQRCVLHISIHSLLLSSWREDDCTSLLAPSSTIAATCLLNIVTSISAIHTWIDLPYLISTAVLLGYTYRQYERELRLAQRCAVAQEEDDEVIQNLF